MSEVRLNIIDAYDVINGTVHGSIADVVIASLSAEPETIAELEGALERYIKPLDDRRPFDSFSVGENFEPWDAGLVIVDLAARVVAADSSYSAPQAQGQVQYHDGAQATDVWLPYRVPDDWLFVFLTLEYEAIRQKRRAERAANPPVDVREVLYGSAMIEFIVLECAAASTLDSHEAESDSAVESSLVNSQSTICSPQSVDPQSIHARWLMTPRADLHGRSPRDVILDKLAFIDLDLQSRAQQWSFLGEGPPPLARDSHAYRFGGFGTHEYVIYYYLVRHLLGECWERAQAGEVIDVAAEAVRREESKQAWLNEPQVEFDGRIPSAIIESERRRIPIVMSAKAMMIDEDCDLCRLMAGETGEDFGPGFWHLDGSGMDDWFEFSTYRTREDWEAEQRKWREFNDEFNRKWAEEHGDV